MRRMKIQDYLNYIVSKSSENASMNALIAERLISLRDADLATFCASEIEIVSMEENEWKYVIFVNGEPHIRVSFFCKPSTTVMYKKQLVQIPEELGCYTVTLSKSAKFWTKFENNKSEITLPPGAKLLEVSRKIFPRKFVSDVLEPTILDLQEEYIETLAKDNLFQRRWICIRGYLSFFLALALGLKLGLIKKVLGVWKLMS